MSCCRCLVLPSLQCRKNIKYRRGNFDSDDESVDGEAPSARDDHHDDAPPEGTEDVGRVRRGLVTAGDQSDPVYLWHNTADDLIQTDFANLQHALSGLERQLIAHSIASNELTVPDASAQDTQTPEANAARTIRELFCNLTGWTPWELLGNPPQILLREERDASVCHRITEHLGRLNKRYGGVSDRHLQSYHDKKALLFRNSSLSLEGLDDVPAAVGRVAGQGTHIHHASWMDDSTDLLIEVNAARKYDAPFCAALYMTVLFLGNSPYILVIVTDITRLHGWLDLSHANHRNCFLSSLYTFFEEGDIEMQLCVPVDPRSWPHQRAYRRYSSHAHVKRSPSLRPDVAGKMPMPDKPLSAADIVEQPRGILQTQGDRERVNARRLYRKQSTLRGIQWEAEVEERRFTVVGSADNETDNTYPPTQPSRQASPHDSREAELKRLEQMFAHTCQQMAALIQQQQLQGGGGVSFGVSPHQPAGAGVNGIIPR
ncbi:unnamed protein product [Vitrella brassicaformis CCMP3155]|uniref:PAS domain-containing protein n=1 Tax=Vitrella brassicaformis (strain CCMP3155) TaxID=1169540 RepID=A0A0G4FHC9_VITBC|nr:unnamed protein product [Vitrella brassicaformis CCMP3155]|eukprot:CEM12867.1 unnamed protein product [Vitrella brassicaformis CCMP3155]